MVTRQVSSCLEATLQLAASTIFISTSFILNRSISLLLDNTQPAESWVSVKFCRALFATYNILSGQSEGTRVVDTLMTCHSCLGIVRIYLGTLFLSSPVTTSTLRRWGRLLYLTLLYVLGSSRPSDSMYSNRDFLLHSFLFSPHAAFLTSYLK